MGRGPKPTKGKAKPAVSRKSWKNGAGVRDLEQRLAETQEQQKATSEILRVISSSPTDVQPVFDAILQSALALCDAPFGVVLRLEGDEVLHLAAFKGPERYAEIMRGGYPHPVTRDRLSGLAILERRAVHAVGLRSSEQFPYGRALANAAGFDATVFVPMLKEGRPIGAIGVGKTDAFSDDQIALLQTFADQAVIAIENVRLFKELELRNAGLSEALMRETATGEILRVIAGSPTELQPVLDAVVTRAALVCAARDAVLYRVTDDELEIVAHVGPIGATLGFRFPLDRGTLAGRAFIDRAPIHVHDLAAEHSEFPRGVEFARRLGTRTCLAVPLVRQDTVLGVLSVRRSEIQMFSDEQITLLRTFADQAVIAIENVRLFTELQEKNQALTEAHAQVSESLDQQTATSEILRVISQSPTDLRPVFDTIIRNAVQLCGATYGSAYRIDGDVIYLVAETNFSGAGWDRFRMTFPRPLREGGVIRDVVESRRLLYLENVDDAYPFSDAARALFATNRTRSLLTVPMIRQDQVIGAFSLFHPDLSGFPDARIDLVKTFADQAVIAIENVRLFTETKEALERQTATSEILRVISQSPTDVQPVFDTIVSSAAALCHAPDVIILVADGDSLRFGASVGPVAASVGQSRLIQDRSLPLTRGSVSGRAVIDRRTVHIHDVSATPDDEFPEGKRLQRQYGGRGTTLAVPLLRDDVSLGVITLVRSEIRPFTDQQVALLETFADQAVIAIENVRLFTETKEALDQQTATSEILRVISQSPTDVQPVFDTIARSAVTLCDALGGNVQRFDGEFMHLVANHNWAPADLARRRLPLRPTRNRGAGRAVLSREVVHIPDVLEDAEYSADVALAGGWRTILSVPILREGNPVGAITVTRAEVSPFSPNSIALLQTFADQAVIAIENVRLFKELERRNRELTQTLDQQTATGEILRVISSAHIDAQPVFDTIVKSAARLCHATVAAVFRSDGPTVYNPANYGDDPHVLAAVRSRFPRPVDMETMPGIAILTRTVAHFPDVEVEESPIPELVRQVGRLLGYRSVVAVPMLREGEAVGALLVARREPGWFSDAEVELLKTFGAQAVIAIENVHLFTELQARTQDLTRSVGQLTALGEVGRAVSSTLDVETVLSTIVSRAIQLSGTDGGSVYEYDEATEEFSLRASRDLPQAYVEQVRDTRPRKGEGAVGRVALTREPVQIADISDPTAYESRVRNTLMQIGLRALLAVPLIAEDHLVGALIVMRKRSGTFAAEEVALLQTFATQSALAIQNARLFREIEVKSRQLEVASQHKSEFLANMSHELRTPLNAIIGFSEVLSERMFGELNEKQEEYLKDIYASGTHLLSLINDILDLSKIEAGRMELELSDFHLSTALDSALTLIRERAGRRSIALHLSVDERLGQIQADERKVRQVVLNLLSNAIKFTPEGGRIEVAAVAKDGLVEIAVSDTGVGIAPEDQEAVFEEFRQVGTADKKVEGTGLGLTLCRKFVELHGGRIWVKSQVGEGSTFTFAIPVRGGE